MSLSTKILLFLGSITIIGLLGLIVYQQFQMSERQKAIETQVVKQKELVDNIMRSQSQYASKDDILKFIKDNNVNLQAIQDDLETLHAEITAVNTILVSSQGQHGSHIPSTGTGPENPNPTPVDPENPDPYGYLSRQQNLNLYEQFGDVKIPFGQVGFSAWQPEPWSVDIPPREYHVTNVIGTDENQRMYVYNKFSIKTGDKNYDVKIGSAETVQEYPEAKWSWFNPRIFVGVDAGVNTGELKGEITPSADIGFMSYGKFKKQPDFSVLQVGIGYGTVSQTAQAIITPVSYNVGQHLPLMNNMYVAPSMHINTAGNISVMAGIRVGL